MPQKRSSDEITQNNENTTEGVLQLQIDSRPSEYEYAKLSQHVYTLPIIGEKVPGLEAWQVIHSWHSKEGDQRVALNNVTQTFSFVTVVENFVTSVKKKITSFSGHIQRQIDFGFAAAIYVNDEHKQLVLAFRGTSDIMGWITDFASIVNTFISPQVPLVQEAIQLAIQKVKEKGYSFHITGHSLGGWLAELGLFFSLLEFKIYTNAVTFESPGAWAFIKTQLLSNLPDIQAQQLEQLRDFADLISLRSYPNSFNTCNLPLGTVKALYPSVLDRSRIPLVYISEVHSIERIVEEYEKSTFTAPVIMADWPTWQHLAQYYKVSDFENQKWLVDEEKYSDFDRYYRAHYKSHDRLNKQNCIHIRHFHPDIRGLLIRLNESLMLNDLNDHRREQLKIQLISQLNFTLEQAILLTYYQIDECRILSVLSIDKKTNKTAEEFRKEMSQLLCENLPKVEKIIFQNAFIQSTSVPPIFAQLQKASKNSRIDNVVISNTGTMVEGDAAYAVELLIADKKARQAKQEEEESNEDEQNRPFADNQIAEDQAIINNKYIMGFFAKSDKTVFNSDANNQNTTSSSQQGSKKKS